MTQPLYSVGQRVRVDTGKRVYHGTIVEARPREPGPLNWSGQPLYQVMPDERLPGHAAGPWVAYEDTMKLEAL